MKILSIISQKGGTGKTTIAENLAVASSLDGRKTVLIDLDSQPTSASWGDRRQRIHPDDDPTVISAQVARLPQILDVCRREKAELVIIDTPPRTAEATHQASKAADLVLVPIRPSLNDVETLPALAELLRLAGKSERAFVVINAAPARGSRHLDAEKIAESHRLEVAPVILRLRQDYGDAPNAGQGVIEFARAGQAASEFSRLWKFVSELMKL
jgi:chromosome partitioning protein